MVFLSDASFFHSRTTAALCTSISSTASASFMSNSPEAVLRNDASRSSVPSSVQTNVRGRTRNPIAIRLCRES